MSRALVIGVIVVCCLFSAALPSVMGASRSPLYRFYQAASDFHFYTADPVERANVSKMAGWKEYQQMGFVYREQVPGTVPLYRLAKSEFGGSNHFYTIDKKEADNASQNLGWTFEGIACYVSKTPVAGTLPFYRLYKAVHTEGDTEGSFLGNLIGGKPFSSTTGDVHFYTTDAPERDKAMKHGFQFVRTEAYVWAQQAPSTPKNNAPAASLADIEKSYQQAFGRAATVNEIAYWTSEVNKNGSTWGFIFTAHENYLKTDAANSERKGMVNRCYYEVFGRYATIAEINLWTDIITAKGLTYMYMLPQYVAYLTGGNPSQNAELKDTIYRAYKVAGFGPPNDFLLKKWTVKAINEKLTFKQIVAGIKTSTFPNGK